jgi:hypothetical protein
MSFTGELFGAFRMPTLRPGVSLLIHSCCRTWWAEAAEMRAAVRRVLVSIFKFGILEGIQYVQKMQKKVIPDHVEGMQRMNVVTKGRVVEKDWAVKYKYEQDWLDSSYTDS